MKIRSKATLTLRAMLARRYGFGASPNKPPVTGIFMARLSDSVAVRGMFSLAFSWRNGAISAAVPQRALPYSFCGTKR